MASCPKLLSKARESPTNLSFKDLCKLAECWEFSLKRQSGSHRIYKHGTLKLPHPHALQNFQPGKNGEAKLTQVDQLLEAIDYIKDKHPDF